MNKLQKALQLNAIFSSISGLVFILLHQTLAEIFTLQQSNIFWMIGIALVFFSITIFWEIKKQRKIGVLWIITQDILWVIGSIILLVLQPFEISSTGNILIALVAIIVGFMALNQAKALQSKI